jgi:eukaryotic-like serine/threonine-protein kinase
MAPTSYSATSESMAKDEVVLGGYIGKYRIIAELGRGGMANVLLAVAQGPARVQKLVALKVLRSAIAAEPETLAMFLDEARLAAQLNHSNVVKTYEVGAEDDQYVIVMEYLEGQPLSAVLRRATTVGTPMPLPHLLRVIIGVLEGLHYAHELTSYDGAPLRLVHRDMSPQNVFLTYDGQVKVVDFGIAKATSSENHTAAGVIKGKLSYMAPEQMASSGIDRRADIYSVGCILWAAAAGKKLWDGVAGVDIARNVMQGRIPLPTTVDPSCSPELERIIMKALAFDPDQRFQTALEFQEALEGYCEKLDSQPREKEVGAFVAGLFAEMRLRLRGALERELKLAALDPRGATGSGTGSVRRKAIAIDGTETAIVPRRGPRWVPLLALVVFGAAAFIAYPRLRSALDRPTTPPARRDGPSPVPALVEWRFSADPPQAELVLDGKPVAGNPAKVSLPRDAKTHVLSASAVGYATRTKEFSADGDGSLQLSLEPSVITATATPSASAGRKQRARWVAPAAPASTHAAAPPAPPAPPAEPAKPTCDQPFFINSEGIKVVRPECM